MGVEASTAHDPVVLTESELERLDCQGFLVVDRPVVAPAELEEVRTLLEGLFERFDRLPREFAYDLGDVKHHDGPQQTPEINHARTLDPRLTDTMAFARCRDLARQILGARVRCVFDHAICKPPDNGASIEWHQDLAYQDLANSDACDVPAQVRVWLALQDVTEAHGCMEYIADDQRRGLLPHRRRGGSLDAHALVAEGVDASAAVVCPVDAGMVTIHRSSTLHSSGPNTTAVPRLAWSLCFEACGPTGPTARIRAVCSKVKRSLLR